MLNNPDEFEANFERLKIDLKVTLAASTKDCPNFNCVSMFNVSALITKTLSSKYKSNFYHSKSV